MQKKATCSPTVLWVLLWVYVYGLIFRHIFVLLTLSSMFVDIWSLLITSVSHFSQLWNICQTKIDSYNFIGLLHHEQRDYMWVQRACIQTLMFYETLLIFKFDIHVYSWTDHMMLFKWKQLEWLARNSRILDPKLLYFLYHVIFPVNFEKTFSL